MRDAPNLPVQAPAPPTWLPGAAIVFPLNASTVVPAPALDAMLLRRPNDPVLLVSFDGGGLRGALTARLWQRLCERLPWLSRRVWLRRDWASGSRPGVARLSG